MGRLPRQRAELPGYRQLRRAAGLAALALALAAAACTSPPPVRVSDGRYAMGTALEITLEARDAAAARALLPRLFARVEEIESELSSWRPESALSRLNARAGGPAQPVPEVLAGALRASLGLAEETGGAFDVTVGPLVRLFDEAAARGRPPDEAELAAARARVGPTLLEVTADGRARLARPGMAVDLGGVGKGYALDLLLPELRAAGVAAALLSFGQSSVLAVGGPAEGGPWRLAVADAEGGILGVVALRDEALSVSSSFGRSREIAGVRYGHVIDPRSGLALTRGRLAAVVAKSGAVAEAWSTALLVLGAEGLPRLARRGGVEALLVDEGGAVTRTPGFPLAEPAPRASE